MIFIILTYLFDLSLYNEGYHTIKVVVTDDFGNTSEIKTVNINIFFNPDIPVPTTISPMNLTCSEVSTFTWDSLDGISEYQFQLSTDSNFEIILLSETTNTNTYNTSIDLGHFYLLLESQS